MVFPRWVVVGLVVAMAYGGVAREEAPGRAMESLGLVSDSVRSHRNLFPGGVVRFVVSVTSETQRLRKDDVRITRAIAEWEKKTCIRFTRCEDEEGCQRPYLVFHEGNGCKAVVGTAPNRRNRISIGPNCGLAGAVHEIGHALGMTHEAARFDGMLHLGREGKRMQALGPFDRRSMMSGGSGPVVSRGDVAAVHFLYNTCSDKYERPLCLTSAHEKGRVNLVRGGTEWRVVFNAAYGAGQTMQVSYQTSEGLAGRVSWSIPTGSSLRAMSLGEVVAKLTPTEADTGRTFTLGASFTGSDGAVTTCSVVVRVVPHPPSTMKPGLRMAVYPLVGQAADADTLPDFGQLGAPWKSTVISEVLLRSRSQWRSLVGLKKHFALRVTGVLYVEQSGVYSFFLTTNNRARLLIDGREVVSGVGGTISGARRLRAGSCAVVVEYLRGRGERAALVLEWQMMGWAEREFVPYTNLFHE